MMRAIIPAFLWISLLVVSACTEVGPNISFNNAVSLIDTAFIDNNLPTDVYRRVVIEEFTGVNCNNCPRGAETIADILSTYGDSVVAIAIHNDNPLARPHSGYEDFRTAEGIAISQKFGGTAAIPSGTVNRTQFPGAARVAVTRNFWEDYSKQHLALQPACELSLSLQFDDNSRELTVTARIHFLRDVDTTTHLSLIITESGIISPQTMPDLSIKNDYEHNHVFRGMMTPNFGAAINSSTETGRVVIKSYQTVLPEGWNPDKCYVVGLVHFIGDADDVIQVDEISIR